MTKPAWPHAEWPDGTLAGMPGDLCPLCNHHPLLTAAQDAMQACATCAETIGIIPMPPSRRPPAPCARCNGRQFVRAIPREHVETHVAGRTPGRGGAPMYVTHVPTSHDGLVFKWVNNLDVSKGFGMLEVYLCRKCGAVEWYCLDVEKVPIHPHLMTELVDYASESPYR